jgi:hypothetical protein
MLQLLPVDMISEVAKYITPIEFKSLYESMNDESLNVLRLFLLIYFFGFKPKKFM